MRVCIAGGGLAGTLLAWRLARHREVEGIDLWAGVDGWCDATEHSGGVVRAYERHPAQRRLAIESLAELRASAVLRQWSQFRETGSCYLRAGDQDVDHEIREVDAAAPGSVRLATRQELADTGWAWLPGDTVGIIERRAGCVSPARLRAALLIDLGARRRVTVSASALATIEMIGDGLAVTASGEDQASCYDTVVLATGAWTPSLLASNGLDTAGLRTKAIQYTNFRVSGPTPPPFVDESTGLYGRPSPGGDLLLGVATHAWDQVPGLRAASPDLQRTAAELARTRLPHLAPLFPLSSINATDCYCEPPVLALRGVPAIGGALWTFTGGSGGSAKTALAASAEAARQLVVPSQSLESIGA